MAGSSGSGGSGGMPSSCSDMPLCQACCDDLYPDLHAAFAAAFYSCACDQCYSVCGTFCSDTYNWDDACLECLQAFASTECSSAAVMCDETPDCEAFATCSFSCL